MILETKGLSKTFGQQYALKDVHLQIAPGEIHGLIGENGAGKSTLIKILTGVYSLEVGQIFWQGQKVDILNPSSSRQLGINVIHQDRHLIPHFNGLENIYLGLEYEKRAKFFIDWDKMKERVENIMEGLSIKVPLNIASIYLTPPEKTLIEIVRGMMTESLLFILDEPTASLTDKEVEVLFDLIFKLKERGTSVLYVTHRMEEIFRLTDRITILKNGEHVRTLQTKRTELNEIVGLMTDNWESKRVHGKHRLGVEMLTVKELACSDQKLRDVSFSVRKGEILGIFGLSGSGRTELLETIYGLRESCSGSITLNGRPYENRNPGASLKKGMVLIAEDRRGKALIASLSVKQNTVLSNIDAYANRGIMDSKEEIRVTKEQIDTLNIRTKGMNQVINQLSGGNQQKIVFAKALLTEPKVFLCDEPTQGVDIKTREEIHNLLRKKAGEGSAIVFVTSDLQEMLDVADNIIILTEGRTVQFLKNEKLTAKTVLSYCYSSAQKKEDPQWKEE